VTVDPVRGFKSHRYRSKAGETPGDSVGIARRLSSRLSCHLLTCPGRHHASPVIRRRTIITGEARIDGLLTRTSDFRLFHDLDRIIRAAIRYKRKSFGGVRDASSA
jgi:hypothetical protein